VSADRNAAGVLASFTGEELLALAERRLDAEARHGWQAAGDMAEAFWSEVESDPDTNAAFDRLSSEWAKPPTRRPSPSHQPGEVRNPSRYGHAVLDAEVDRLGQAEEGERNLKLNLAAYHLGRLVGAGHLDAAEVIDALFDAGQSLGLRGWEIRSTIRSGLDAGIRRPRR
jgi:hypothetical protein